MKLNRNLAFWLTLLLTISICGLAVSEEAEEVIGVALFTPASEILTLEDVPSDVDRDDLLFVQGVGEDPFAIWLIVPKDGPGVTDLFGKSLLFTPGEELRPGDDDHFAIVRAESLKVQGELAHGELVKATDEVLTVKVVVSSETPSCVGETMDFTIERDTDINPNANMKPGQRIDVYYGPEQNALIVRQSNG